MCIFSEKILGGNNQRILFRRKKSSSITESNYYFVFQKNEKHKLTDYLRPGVQDQPGQHGETPFLIKIQKLARYSGAHLRSQLLRRLRWENCLNRGNRDCSEPRSYHYTTAWATEPDSVSKKQENKTTCINNTGERTMRQAPTQC